MRVYGRAGVSEACLWLQDRHGLDVNFLLFSIWTGLGRGPLESERFDRALGFSREWSDNVVARLRAARRWLKAPAPEALKGAAERTALSPLRADLVELERRAEKLQQEALERMVGDLPAVRQEIAAARVAAHGNVRRYLLALNVEADAAIESRLAVIVGSALA